MSKIEEIIESITRNKQEVYILHDTDVEYVKVNIQALLEEQYQKGFIDGSHTTAEQSNEIHAVKLNEQLDEVRLIVSGSDRIYTDEHDRAVANDYKTQVIEQIEEMRK